MMRGFHSLLRSAPILRLGTTTWIIIFVLGCVQLHMWLPEDVLLHFYSQFGLEQSKFISGKVWTIITYGLIHHPTNLSHLLLNVFGLIFIGGRIQHILGLKVFMLTLVTGIFFGGVIHLLVSLISGDSSIILIGMSGGICALFALLAGISPDSLFWPLRISGRNLRLAFMITSGVLVIISPQFGIPIFAQLYTIIDRFHLSVLFSFSHACHLGGLLSGCVLSHYMFRIPQLPKR